MNQRSLAIAATIALSIASLRPTLAAEQPGVRFRGIEDGFAEARATGKPLLLFFTADWCPPCHALELDFFRSSHLVKRIEGDFVPVKVVDRVKEDGHNVPEIQRLIDSAGVSGFPTLLVVHADGAAAVRKVGYASQADTLGFLREAVSRLDAAEKKAAERRGGSSTRSGLPR